MDAKKIGMRLSELRGGKSTDQVAEDLGVSYSAMRMYERGERIPRDEIKLKIAHYFGRTVQEIFFD
ncbi:hypothetical protein DSECCO2_483190 [anaerobic digester metagenome]